MNRDDAIKLIAATAANRKALRAHAREAMSAYSSVMTWLVLDGTELDTITEPQGQTSYVGSLPVIAATGDFYKAHGDGAAKCPATGKHYKSQREYLDDLLGHKEAARIFGSKKQRHVASEKSKTLSRTL